MNYAYDFDRAVISPSGAFAVIYTERQTKSLVLKHGEIVREINRSFFSASSFEYPIAAGQLPDGREVLAHCPDDPETIEIEDLGSGRP